MKRGDCLRTDKGASKAASSYSTKKLYTNNTRAYSAIIPVYTCRCIIRACQRKYNVATTEYVFLAEVIHLFYAHLPPALHLHPSECNHNKQFSYRLL